MKRITRRDLKGRLPSPAALRSSQLASLLPQRLRQPLPWLLWLRQNSTCPLKLLQKL